MADKDIEWDEPIAPVAEDISWDTSSAPDAPVIGDVDWGTPIEPAKVEVVEPTPVAPEEDGLIMRGLKRLDQVQAEEKTKALDAGEGLFMAYPRAASRLAYELVSGGEDIHERHKLKSAVQEYVEGKHGDWASGSASNIIKGAASIPEILMTAPPAIVEAFARAAAEATAPSMPDMGRGEQIGEAGSQLVEDLGGWVKDILDDPLTAMYERPEEVAFALELTKTGAKKTGEIAVKPIEKVIAKDLKTISDKIQSNPELARKVQRPTADIGQPEPITAAPTEILPPLEAIQSAPKPPQSKYAGSINLERMDVTSGAKEVLEQAYEANKGMIDEARRGVITEVETTKLANELGLTPKELLKRQTGEAWNAERALAARQILASSAERLAKLQEIAKENNSDINLVNLKEAVVKHSEIQAQVSGIASEAGRALRQFRMEAGPEAGYKAALDAMGGREMTQAMADAFAKIDFSNPAEVNKFVRDATKATTPDMIYEAWINAILSSPATHAVNITSNAMTFLTKFPELATAAGIEAGKAAIKGTPRERFFGEVPYQAFGTWEGIKSGARKGVWSYMNEMGTEGVSKIETRVQTAIPSKKFNVLGKEIKVGGKQVRIPGRLLIAMDEFFKAINYETTKKGLAYRKANSEGLKGQAKVERIAELTENPTRDMDKAARDEMLYRVFQKELGATGRAIQTMRYDIPALKVILPFLRTPINIAKYGLERTPLNYARIANRVRKGEIKGGQLSDELARATVGSMVQAAIFESAVEGNITGAGPSDKNERELMYRLGWQPYSIKVGDEYYSYGRFEPAGMVVGLAADAREIWDVLDEQEREDLATLIIRATATNLSQKTFLRGISDIMGVMFDPERHLESYTQKLAGSVIPAGVAAVEKGVDPELRDAQTVVDVLKSRMPGLSKDLPYRVNLWGDKISREGGMVARIASPVYTSKLKGNKIDKEMQKLKLYIGSPSRSIDNIKLSPKQYLRYATKSGRHAKKLLLKKIDAPEWNRMKDDAKEVTIRTVIRATRQAASAEIKRDRIKAQEMLNRR
jgi:phage FluMu protein gp41